MRINIPNNWKPLHLLTALLYAALTLGSCHVCTKQACSPDAAMGWIDFYNYDQKDLQDIVIYRYARNSNFSNPLDSGLVPANLQSDHFRVRYRLSSGNDYRINLRSIKQNHFISNFEVTRKAFECNGPGCGTDYYDVVQSYTLDGQRFTTLPVTIRK